MSEITNPHDKFFKETFSQLEVTRDFLQNYLPALVLAQLDLTSIELEKETFINPHLREHFSDLLFRVVSADGLGTAFIFFLFEHKSRWDKWTWLQLLGYIVNVWERQMEQKPKPFLPSSLWSSIMAQKSGRAAAN